MRICGKKGENQRVRDSTAHVNIDRWTERSINPCFNRKGKSLSFLS